LAQAQEQWLPGTRRCGRLNKLLELRSGHCASELPDLLKYRPCRNRSRVAGDQ
jgi:hypothetical protein